MRDFIKRIGCLLVAAGLIMSVAAMPAIRVYAAEGDGANLYEEYEDAIKIDTSTVTLADTWQQIKNAAIVHLITQKFAVCVAGGHIVSDDGEYTNDWRYGNDVRNSITGAILHKGAAESGNVWKGAVGTSGFFSGEWRAFDQTQVGAGPWLAGVLSSSDGTIKCSSYTSNGNLFDMFVYIYKNYNKLDAENFADGKFSSVTATDRLKVICQGSEPGILQPAYMTSMNSNFEITSVGPSPEKNCMDQMDAGNMLDFYIGSSLERQMEVVEQIYKTIQTQSGNPYLQQISWDELDYYDKVEGYYLYSNDFEKQCGGKSVFSETAGSDGHTYVAGFYVDNETGEIQSGYYRVTDSNARQSFVAESFTCAQLVEKMNETIKPYAQYANYQIWSVCGSGIVSAAGGINDKKAKLYEILNSDGYSDEVKEKARNVVAIYDGIISSGAYVVRREDKSNPIDVYSLSSQRGMVSQSDMPTDYIWQCRESLPFIRVEIEYEPDMKDQVQNEFSEEWLMQVCQDNVDHLAWIICPIIVGISEAVDGLGQMVGDFFE